MTASLLVMPNIFASGNLVRHICTIAALMRVATPCPRYSGLTIMPELATNLPPCQLSR